MGKLREFMDVWFQRVWNENDTDYIFEACDIDVSTKGHADKPLLGPDDFLAFHGALNQLMNNITIEITDSLENDTELFANYEVRGEHPQTGAPVVTTGNTFVRIEDGKIKEAHEHYDFMGFFQKLGTLPPDAMQMCMAGKSIAHHVA